MAIEFRLGPAGQAEHDAEVRRAIEGEERIPFLHRAELVAVAPGPDADEPPFVAIRWTADATERPFPGTAIWRAALAHYLASPIRDPATEPILRPVVAAALTRFPSLEAWLRWADHERRPREAAPVRPPRISLRGPGWSW